MITIIIIIMKIKTMGITMGMKTMKKTVMTRLPKLVKQPKQNLVNVLKTTLLVTTKL